jgi:hypothetical protein
MRDLRLVAVSPEGTHLVLEDGDQEQYRLRHDDRLAAVVRDHARPRQLEIPVESQLSPRDIQARIRAGQSIADVAAAAGMPAARVERYAGPVLAEREHVVRQAQAAPSRRHSTGPAPRLGELVETRLEEQQVAEDAVAWDAWRVEDDRWTVRLSYLAGARERVAEWVFDPRGRVLTAANDEARWLVEESAAERGEDPAVRVRRLTSVPHVAEPAAPAQDQVYDREADQQPPAEPDVAPPAHAARGGRRPSLPSWDDIMFGTRRRP